MKGAIEILLVEDVLADIDLAKLGFKRAKITNNVHVAQTAEKACLFLDKKPPYEGVPTPDLVFLDLGLPGSPGTKVLEHLAANEDLAGIPVIVLTGNDSDAAMKEAYALQANCFLKKPVDLSLLLEAVTNLDGFFLEISKEPG